MAKNRKAFIEVVEKMLKEIDPQNKSIPVLVERLKKAPTAQFEQFIEELRNGIKDHPDYDKPRQLIPIVVPNGAKTAITVERNKQLLEKWKIPYFERVWRRDPATNTMYLTNRPYIVVIAPISRQAQTLEKKISYSESDTVLDARTNAPANSVAGSGFSGPELHSLLSQGRIQTAKEIMKFRGGDDMAYRAMVKSLSEDGTFSMDSYPDISRAKSTDVVGMYLKAAHLDNDI